MASTVKLPAHSTAGWVQARPAHTIPKSGDGVASPRAFVSLHHPGWADDNLSLLFTIPACSLNEEGTPCVDFRVAWQGCCVIAIDRPGFFTRGRDRGSEKVLPSQPLTAGKYWYHLDAIDETEDEVYGTLESFRAWQYDPDRMPEEWKEAVP